MYYYIKNSLFAMNAVGIWLITGSDEDNVLFQSQSLAAASYLELC